jgi:uncharacterized protein YeaO (DUF488 family)
MAQRSIPEAAPEKSDGTRVLIDRVWPRGVRKDEAALDEWLKDIAPTTELRKWFGHSPVPRVFRSLKRIMTLLH